MGLDQSLDSLHGPGSRDYHGRSVSKKLPCKYCLKERRTKRIESFDNDAGKHERLQQEAQF